MAGIALVMIIAIICIFTRRRRRRCGRRNDRNVNECRDKAELPADNQGTVVWYEMDSYRQHE